MDDIKQSNHRHGLKSRQRRSNNTHVDPNRRRRLNDVTDAYIKQVVSSLHHCIVNALNGLVYQYQLKPAKSPRTRIAPATAPARAGLSAATQQLRRDFDRCHKRVWSC